MRIITPKQIINIETKAMKSYPKVDIIKHIRVNELNKCKGKRKP